MVAVLGAFVGSVIGAIIGGVVWIGVMMVTGYQVSWIAIGVGGLVGLGAKIGGRDLDGNIAGAIAGTFAIGSILLSKVVLAGMVLASTGGIHERDEWVLSNLTELVLEEQGQADITAATLSAAVERYDRLTPEEIRRYRGYPPSICPEYVKVYMAHDLLPEYEAKGKTVEFPEGMTGREAWLPSHFPVAFWSDVEARWKSMPAAAQQSYKDSVDAFVNQTVTQYYKLPDSKDPMDLGSSIFSLYDILWAVLALGMAFKIGSS